MTDLPLVWTREWACVLSCQEAIWMSTPQISMSIYLLFLSFSLSWAYFVNFFEILFDNHQLIFIVQDKMKKFVVFSYISLLTLLPPLQLSIVISQKTAIDRAKIFSPLFFIYFFLQEKVLAKKKFLTLCPELNNVVFWAEARKASNFRKG